jgi:prepilin-type processing-associated H-X9-DG protein
LDFATGVPYGRSNYVGVAGTDPAWINAATGGASSGIAGTVGTLNSTSGYPVVVGAIYVLGISAAASATVSTDSYGGMFGVNSKRGFREMTDGSSNAVVAGERYSPVATSGPVLLYGDATWVGVDGSGYYSAGMVLGESSVPINAFFTSSTPRPSTSGFGSMHGGGSHFLMGDGAVRFINQNIDMNTYRQLSRVADGAVVGEF